VDDELIADAETHQVPPTISSSRPRSVSAALIDRDKPLSMADTSARPMPKLLSTTLEFSSVLDIRPIRTSDYLLAKIVGRVL
jgi:hypothetical protein